MRRRLQRLVPSVRVRILLLVLLCAAPGIMLVSYASRREHHAAVANARDATLHNARILAGRQENLIGNGRQLLTALAQVPAITGSDPAACNALLADVAPNFPAFTSFWVAGLDGRATCSSITPLSTYSSSQRPWFRQVVETRAFAAGEYQIGGTTGRPVMVLATPILGDDGALVAVLATALDLAWLSREVATLPELQHTSVTIADRAGTILVRHPQPEQWTGTSWAASEIGTFVQSHPQFDGTVEARGLGGERKLYGVTPFGEATGATLAIGIPLSQVTATADRVWRLEMAALAGILLVMVGLAWFGSQVMGVRRLRQLFAVAHALRAGDLSARVPSSHVQDELTELAASFNGMAEAIQERDAAIREQDDWSRLLLASGDDTLLVYPTPSGGRYERFIEANDAACARLGYTREELLALTPADIADLSTLTNWPEVATQLEQRGNTLFETVHLTKDGRRIPVEVNVERVELRGRHISVAVCRDITARKAAEVALRDSEERFRTLVQNTTDLLTIINEDGTIRYASPAGQRLLGYELGTWIGKSVFDLVHPDDRERVREKGESVRTRPGTHPPTEARLRHADGSWRHFEIVSNNQLDNPSVQGIVQTVHDVSQWRQAEATLRASEEWFRALVQHSTDLTAILSAEGVIRYVTPSVAEILGFEESDLLGREVRTLLHPDDHEGASKVFRTWLDTPGEAITTILRLRDRAGEWHVLEATGTNLLAHPSIGGIVFNTRDVTERQRLEDQLKREALNDTLTGLPNRRLFVDRLTHALDTAGRREVSISVLFLDLDGFKRVNDTLGHAAGDALLVAVAGRLSACLRPMDTIARMGGDEFTVLLEDVHTSSEVLTVAERLIAALGEPFLLNDTPVTVGVSIGITFSGSRAITPDDLLREADAALYQAKGAGRGRAVVFDAAMDAEARARAQLDLDLRRAIERGQLVVHYQPELDLASGEVCGVEALIRWQHPTQGLLPPGDFLPMAEGAGLMPGIGAWAIGIACAQVHAWQQSGRKDLTLNVNLSPRQFRQPHLAGQIAAILAETGLSPASLRLEIAESTLMADPEAAIARCQELSALGVRLAIDNFGAGSSSLTYLRRLPLDTVKVSRAFVAELADDQEIVAVVRAITTLAHDLGIAVTAEGLETRSQLASAVALNCHRGQGYLFAAPADAATIGHALAGTPGGNGQRVAGNGEGTEDEQRATRLTATTR